MKSLTKLWIKNRFIGPPKYDLYRKWALLILSHESLHTKTSLAETLLARIKNIKVTRNLQNPQPQTVCVLFCLLSSPFHCQVCCFHVVLGFFQNGKYCYENGNFHHGIPLDDLCFLYHFFHAHAIHSFLSFQSYLYLIMVKYYKCKDDGYASRLNHHQNNLKRTWRKLFLNSFIT